MTLTTGMRIGPYEITGWLGAGGMGEVYRACDTRLDRDVAIKRIAEQFATDPVRVQRFEQEARTVGQLNHPNVLAVYDVGAHDGTPYLVSELLAGESLRARVSRGAVPARRAIEYARQTAEGLAAAHAKGIVHRDLKPDNLFITVDDRVKILDFGLAKLVQPTEQPISGAAETEIGALLGTIDYMSPEQVRGEAVDARTDIFSLGIILQEMLTGRAPFARPTAPETMAAILHDDPLASWPAEPPAALGRIVGRCLEKVRETRFQSARDLAFGLEVLSRADLSAPSRVHWPAWLRTRTVPWGLAAMLAAGLAASRAQRTASPQNRSTTPLRLSVDLGADAPLGQLGRQFGNAVTISPDGSTLAFVAQRSPDVEPQLWIRKLGETRATLLAGTEQANAPFFSPDGAWIGFDTGLELKKVAVTGGAPIFLTSENSFRGASWSSDGTLVFSPGQTPGIRLMHLAATGGTPTPVTTLTGGDAIHAWPQVLPGGKAVLYTSSRVTGAYNDANLVVQPLPAGAPTVVQRGGYHGVYLRSGHIVYVHDGALLALPFDAERLLPTGPAVRVLDGVASNALTGGAQFSVSDGGTLVYLSGPSIGAGVPLELVDRQGAVTPLRTTLANWFTPAFAPDGRRVALAIREGPTETGDIWVHERGRPTLLRVTSDPAADTKPVWTPDGSRITFASNRGDRGLQPNLYWQAADGSGTAQRLTTSVNEQAPGSWHPSGNFLAFEELTTDRMRDVMILPMVGDEASGWKPGVPMAFVTGPKMDWEPRFSPDGHWLAYASTESGRWEVYVRPFPGPGPAVQVSSGGGELPTWSTKHEIVYGLDGQLFVVPYTVEGSRFTVAAARPWPGGRYQGRGRNRMFDVQRDGEHAVLAVAANQPGGEATRAVQFIFNFFDELQRLAPAVTPSTR